MALVTQGTAKDGRLTYNASYLSLPNGSPLYLWAVRGHYRLQVVRVDNYDVVPLTLYRDTTILGSREVSPRSAYNGTWTVEMVGSALTVKLGTTTIFSVTDPVYSTADVWQVDTARVSSPSFVSLDAPTSTPRRRYAVLDPFAPTRL